MAAPFTTEAILELMAADVETYVKGLAYRAGDVGRQYMFLYETLGKKHELFGHVCAFALNLLIVLAGGRPAFLHTQGDEDKLYTALKVVSPDLCAYLKEHIHEFSFEGENAETWRSDHNLNGTLYFTDATYTDVIPRWLEGESDAHGSDIGKMLGFICDDPGYDGAAVDVFIYSDALAVNNRNHNLFSFRCTEAQLEGKSEALDALVAGITDSLVGVSEALARMDIAWRVR